MRSFLSSPPRTALRSRAATVTGLAAATLLLIAGPASAHVTVNPGSAAKGSYTEVNVRVPNEETGADTTKIEFYLPTDHPIASVSTENVPGWTATVQKTKLSKPITTDDGQITEAVSEITWSGGTIKPGQFQDFALSLGPLPTDTDSLTFKALQTYSDGSVVRWIQPTVAGQAEPANPAPVLRLTAATASASTDSASASARPTVTTTTASGSSGSDTTARVLAGVGLVVGLLGVGFGFLGWRRGGTGGRSAG
ncbi:YcnI family protein [Streptacidiphilus carbonis]|jgi:periplasmic copper chaperone A|uniref:YcnI family protein n=1 Tax=Streptacidiphilus carbonis TaxID=105422 RepID=UPI000A61F6B4|nr:YcnI family protein [Streptacidiphilus carbonis]